MKKLNISKCFASLIFLFILLIIYFNKFILKTIDIDNIDEDHKIFKNKNKFLNSYESGDKIGNFEIDQDYPEDFERYIFDKIKDRLRGPQVMSLNEYYFINGLIRKYKPKKILEIGVCSGGMSAVILNAIMDIEDAFVYSCDLEKKNYKNSSYDIGMIVKNNFPEFFNRWKLYTGNTTSAFIEEIGKGIDFVFIDTSHVMPGEVLNLIEIFPFLKKRAIIAFDDIDHQTRKHLTNLTNFYPCNNLLFSVLRGKKIIIDQKNNNIFNFRKVGAVILDDEQENYFFEYFYLLTNNWSYMPNIFEIDIIRKLVAKYYKPIFLSIFEKAVSYNYNRLLSIGLLKRDYRIYTFKDFRKKKEDFLFK